MTSYFLPGLAAAALLVSSAYAQDKLELNTPKQRVSYAIGTDIASNMKRQELDLDPKALAAGLMDAFAGKLALTDAEIKKSLEEFSTEMRAKMQAKQAEMQAKQAELQAKLMESGPKNLKDGEAFLAANAKKDGVKSTASGLQYKSLKAGKGNSPKATDTVKVHYHGTLIDGTVFDSSVDNGKPVSFALNQVIPGWTEALQLMKEGDKWQIYVPSKLAYGERGYPPKIGPNSTLIFDVELLGIEKGDKN